LGLHKSDYVERQTVPVVTFTQVCDAWEKKRLPTLALSSRTELPGQLARHLRPFFGAMRVETIKTGIVNDWIIGLNKQDLHPKTVHNKWQMFRSIMNWHTDQQDKPRRKWSPDLPHIPDVEQRWLTPSEMLQIIEAVRAYPTHGQVEGQYKPLMRVDAFTGLRSGEVQGLNAEDFDFERGILHVQRSLYKQQEVPTKGKRRRYVFVDSVTSQIVKEFLGECTTGRLFNSRLGTALCNQQLNTVMRWATKKFGLKAATMHSYRHGRFSLLDSLGVSTKVVQEQVGHQNKRTTFKYTHKEESELRDMMNRIGPIVHGPSRWK
jgi:integrase